MVREQGNKAGGPWDCYDAEDFFGWEADRVIAVTGGDYIMELMTRARTRLCVVLVERPFHPGIYSHVKEYFQQAADQGLVSMGQLSADVIGINQGEDQVNDELLCCNSTCCTS